MYTDIYLNPQVRTSLEALEQELGLPIRVIQWNNRRAEGFAWSSMERLGLSIADAAEQGITVWAQGPRPEGFSWHSIDIDSGTYYECVNYPTEPASPIMYADQIIGEVLERGIGLAFSPTDSYAVSEGLCTAIVEGVRASLDPEFLAGMEARAIERQRAAFEDYVQRSYDSRFANHRGTIDAHLQSVASWQEAIVNAMRLVQQENELLDALILVRQNDAGDEFMRQWQQLEDHPRIARVRFSAAGGNSVTITTTDDLRMYHPVTGESRWLGAFNIVLNLETMAIRLNNLNTIRGGRDHPHVTGGRACFGGHQTAFTELLTKGEIYTLFELLIQYLETLNLADEYGRYGAYWFDAPDARPLEPIVVDEAGELVTA